MGFGGSIKAYYCAIQGSIMYYTLYRFLLVPKCFYKDPVTMAYIFKSFDSLSSKKSRTAHATTLVISTLPGQILGSGDLVAGMGTAMRVA